MDVPSVAPAAAGQQQAAPPLPAQPAGAVPQQPLPQSVPDGKETLSPVAAKLFGDGSKQVNVNVSYRVENGEVVTVFTDPQTGHEITQVPSEVMLQLAQFFDKQNGVTLDKSA